MTQQVRTTIKDALQRAFQLHSAGRIADAQKICLQITKVQPTNIEAHNFLGATKIQLGMYDAAIQHLNAAINLNPNSANILSNLGLAHQKIGDMDRARHYFEKAVDYSPKPAAQLVSLAYVLSAIDEHKLAIENAEKAITLEPDSANTYNCAACCYIANQDFVKARELLETALAQDPKNAIYLHNMGELALRLGQIHEALDWTSRAEERSPNDVKIWRNKSIALFRLSRYSEALTYADRILKEEPDNPEAILHKGRIFSDSGAPARAIELYSEFLGEHPECALVLESRGHVLAMMNDPENAQADFKRALELTPNSIIALSGLSQFTPYTSDNPYIPAIHAISKDTKLPLETRSKAHFEMAKVYDDIDDVAGLFRSLEIAHSLERRGSGYAFDRDLQKFDDIKRLYASINKSDCTRPKQVQRLKHIFILGMPRSGTTLAEQIISAHSTVYGAGELTKLESEMQLFIRGTRSESRTIQTSDIRRISNQYSAFVQSIDGVDGIATDKMPSNFLWIGFILLMFPDAKIIHLNRDPRAVCWSIYKTAFGSLGHGYAHRFADLAHYYALYLDLMEFWRAEWPDHIYELTYEKLTENQEEETRKLIANCELEWEDACLAFYDNKRAVATSSLQQVRKKMYTGSSNSWRRYESSLDPLLEALAAHGVPMPD